MVRPRKKSPSVRRLLPCPAAEVGRRVPGASSPNLGPSSKESPMHTARQISRRSPWSGSGRGRLGFGALAAAIAVQLATQAQEPAPGTLEEITVTARRVQENLQDTPLAVSVFSGDELT